MTRAATRPLRNRLALTIVVAAVVLVSTSPAPGGLARRERKSLEQIAGRPVSGFEPKTVIHDDGGRWDADSFRGKVTLVNFWATWCPPCLDEIPLLERAHRDWASRGLRVLGVTTFADGDEQRDAELKRIEEVLEAHEVSYANLISTEQSEWDAYRVDGLPVTILVGRDGLPLDYAMGIKGLRRILKRVEEMLVAGP